MNLYVNLLFLLSYNIFHAISKFGKFAAILVLVC